MRKLSNEELDRLGIDEFKRADKHPLIIVLDNVRSLHNVGAIFRTADAFLIEKIYLCGITPMPPHKDIRKTALGATESVDWEYVEDIEHLTRELRHQRVELIAVEQAEHSVKLDEYEPQNDKRTVMVFGNEVKGVRQEVVNLCDKVVEIPQFGTKHSLNISVSAGICIWHHFFKMNKKSRFVK